MNAIIAQDSIPWHHNSNVNSNYEGISLQEGLDFMSKKGKKQSIVIVAVIDSGIDTLHEDLSARLWNNPKEIPYNNIDDDGNGYIDDIHGWNFIGGANGENVNGETIEMVRFYKDHKAKFDGKSKGDIAKEDKELYKKWLIAKEETLSEIEDSKKNKEYIKEWLKALIYAETEMEAILKTDSLTIELVNSYEPTNDEENRYKAILKSTYEMGLSRSELKDYLKHYNDNLEKSYSLTYDPRPGIVGDDVNDINDTIYGNNDIQAKGYSHGTGVSGIIGAIRNNGIGTQGIIDSVQIMVLRVVPGGDERDKDVALAIRYAVKNGATIINGSFGKKYSNHPEFVKDAIDYAVANDVLFVHAAGNEGENNDKVTHFPTAIETQRTNWIDVGASGPNNDDMKLAAEFSNYGKKTVDIFAPGVDIYSVSPNNKYGASSGTSDACPVVSGVAALVKSYYPQATAEQIRTILIESAVKHKKTKVKKPGSKKKIKFGKLSTDAGIVNAYEALKIADEMFAK